MPSLKNYKLSIAGLIFACSQCHSNLSICLSGRVATNLPAYHDSILNAVNLALPALKGTTKEYFFGNGPLEPLGSYEKMKNDHCSAIIGYEYLSDLLLVSTIHNGSDIPIFTSYASTESDMKLPKNIHMLMPTYRFLASRMIDFVAKKTNKINSVLIITEINRSSMSGYKKAFSHVLNQRGIAFDTYDFLENQSSITSDLVRWLNNRKYKFVFLLSGVIAASQIADILNNHKTVFLGTETFGSSSLQSFYVRISDKKIRAYFIRNLDYLMPDKDLKNFRSKYIKEFSVEPTILSVYAYDAARMIPAIISSKNPPDHHLGCRNSISGARFCTEVFERSHKYAILSVTPEGYKYVES